MLRISVFIMILISILLGAVCAQSVVNNQQSAVYMDAVLLIDNSGSMDWQGHDPEKDRFESARIFIDQSEEGDQIALIDFSGPSKFILPLTKVTEGRKSIMKSVVSTVRSDRKLTDIDSALRLALQEFYSNRADPGHTPIVILLTDGEIDVVEGTPEQKRIAAKRSELILFSETIPEYVQNYIPIYTVALKSGMDTSVLEKIAERTKLREQANERHYFLVNSGTELIDIFSVILSQIKKQSRVVNRYHFTGEPIHQKTDTTPFTKKLNVDVLLDNKENMQVVLKDPDGKDVQPYSQGDKYNLYRIENPALGQWDVSIEGKGENEVIIAMNVDDEMKIDLPFAGRFKLGEDIPIFANVMYKNSIVEGSVFEVEFSGQKHLFKIKDLLLSVQKPNGLKNASIPLKGEGGRYSYYYKNADMVGYYTFDFNLGANLMNREINLSAQKKVYVSKAVELPIVLFKRLKNTYSLGEVVLIELSVTKNAELMQNSSIPVEVTSPRGSEIFPVPRKEFDTYAVQYAQTDREGEYIFTVMSSEEYKVINFQQSIVTVASAAFPRKLLALLLTIFALIGLVIIGMIKGWYSSLIKRLPKAPLIKTPEVGSEQLEQPEEVERGEEYPVPDEILIWDNCVLTGIIRLVKRSYLEKRPTYYLEGLGEIGIFLNNAPVEEVGALVNIGDTVKLNKFRFRITLSKDGSARTFVFHEDMVFRISNEEHLKKWFVIPTVSNKTPRKGDIISPTFVRGNILSIGRNVTSQTLKTNDIILLHPSVDERHLIIRRDRSFNYFLKALSETNLNDMIMKSERETQIYNGDIVKIGVFTFRIFLDKKSKFQLRVTGYEG